MALLRLFPVVFLCAAASALAQDYGEPATEPPPVMGLDDLDEPPAEDGVPDDTGPEAAVAPTPLSIEPEPEPPAPPADLGEPMTAPLAGAETPADAPPAAPTPPARPRVRGAQTGGAVDVGALGTVEGPVAGTLDDTSGGLGHAMWNGMDRAGAETTLVRLGPATSPVVRLLLRKLLLTAAPPPTGQADAPFNAVRLRTLLNAGFLNGAAGVAAQVRAPSDAETSRAQADALLFAGDDANACGDATAHRLESADLFWIELRAYCYALAKDPALELTRAILGGSDPGFNALLSGVITGQARANVAYANPTALHVRMMQRLKLPLTREVAELGTPGAFIVAQSATTPKPIRIAAAEEALRAGALPPQTLAQVLDFIPVKPADLPAAATIARTQMLMPGLALLRAALKREADPAKRAELVHTAFRMGEEHRLLPHIAPVFADAALSVAPRPEWSNWAPTMVRGLFAASRPDAAQAWANAGDNPELAVICALMLQDQAHAMAAQAALSNLADQTLVSLDAAGAKAVLYFGLFEALAMPLPPDAEIRVAPLMVREWPGRRPSAAVMKRIDDAALAGRRGEVVLNVIAVLGQGPGDLAPDVTVRLVRALQTAGVNDAAHALAAEAATAR